jgi:hypothetical protein
MNTDDRKRDEEEVEAPAHPGLMQRLGHAATERELHMLDGAIGFFQRWRGRIAPPDEEDDDRRGGRRPAKAEEPAPAAPVDAAKHHRRRGFLIVVALLLAAGVGGMFFSYALFSKLIESDDLIIDDLRDQVAQMEKAEARSLSLQAKDQNQLAEDRKTIREQQAKLDEYEAQLTQLRQRMATFTPPPPQAQVQPPAQHDTVVNSGSRQIRVGRRPQKTGKCDAGSGSAAADIARCVDTFNKP